MSRESTNCLHDFEKSLCNKDTSCTNEETIHKPTAQTQGDANLQNMRFHNTLDAFIRRQIRLQKKIEL